MVPPLGYFQCGTCNQVKLLSEFPDLQIVEGKRKGRTWCSACRRASQRQRFKKWYKVHVHGPPETTAEAAKKGYEIVKRIPNKHYRGRPRKYRVVGDPFGNV